MTTHLKRAKGLSCLCLLVFFNVAFVNNTIKAQAANKRLPTEDDKKSLEGVIVEKYYVVTAADMKDTLGGKLANGSITYRIYLDLKPGYAVMAVFGSPEHALHISTTTEFFNNTDGGSRTGDQIKNKKINSSTVALDSWVTIGFATDSLFGVPKTEDKDGSIIKRTSLNKEDGLLKGRIIHPVVYIGDDFNFFYNQNNASSFKTDNASWAVLGGMKGVTDDNKVLIAQLTTNGKLSFELNAMIGSPTGVMMQFVAKNPQDSEVQFNGLSSKQ